MYIFRRPELTLLHNFTPLMFQSWFECSAKGPVFTWKGNGQLKTVNSFSFLDQTYISIDFLFQTEHVQKKNQRDARISFSFRRHYLVYVLNASQKHVVFWKRHTNVLVRKRLRKNSFVIWKIIGDWEPEMSVASACRVRSSMIVNSLGYFRLWRRGPKEKQGYFSTDTFPCFARKNKCTTGLPKSWELPQMKGINW